MSNQTADRLLQLEGTVVIPGHNQAKIVMLPPDYMEQLETKEEMEMALTESELVDELIVQSRSPSPELLCKHIVVTPFPLTPYFTKCLLCFSGHGEEAAVQLH